MAPARALLRRFLTPTLALSALALTASTPAPRLLYRSLAHAAPSALGLRTSFPHFAHLQTRSMGSDASKADPGSFEKGKSEQEWRAVLSPEQVSGSLREESKRCEREENEGERAAATHARCE